jgi:pimeloyl-ACP methyl ester carboxylesterase
MRSTLSVLLCLLLTGCEIRDISESWGAPDPLRHTVIADGHPLTVWEKRPERPQNTILLVHGRTWSSLPDFDLAVPGERLSLMDALAARGYITYAVDLRGYGGTPRDSTGWATPDRSAADVAAVLEWIAGRPGVLRPPALFGWSLGAMVSQLTAQRHPDLISALVLYGYPYGPAVDLPAVSDTARPARQPTTAEAAASDFITEGAISDRAVRAYVEAVLAADPIRVDWRWFGQFHALDPEQITVPTMLIHGEFDPLAQPDAHAELFAALGNTGRQWVVIAGGDHAVHLERPRQFLHALVSFLQRPG